ncbi:tyrosine protein phosphatase [Vagococcus penaei]|uniref:Tyrosine-protein phosphatase n=1 Tax=Vagococcus penaei TaxID=633807 RepID=A0A1Q2D466_9ENTE|nr:CpsB/CapC family capsule biosynthesis tyrosine phosphatase [Vagococcus penaei]AQP53101.1 tyrosine protein phosphatase [Vagococcus penaei]RSU06037.1 tyrosine protein phosphatase [Vagococcus penaei]
MTVDIHCHILPGVDDGAKTLEDSLEMARVAVSEGITHILCTPHHNNGVFTNEKDTVITQVQDLQDALDDAGIPLIVLEGQEVRLSGDLLDRIKKDTILFADLNNIYILIEFPAATVPAYAEQVLFDLCTNGYTPIIVHPERNTAIIHNPNILLPFIEMGCITQVTNASYVGEFGKEIEKTAKLLIKHNYAHLLASDAHNTERRGFFTAEALAKLEKEFGEEKLEYFKQTAKDVINGDRTHTLPEKEYRKKFLGLF